MKVYGVVRKDDPERKPIESASGRFVWGHKSGAKTFLRYMAEHNFGAHRDSTLAQHEIATYELVEVKS